VLIHELDESYLRDSTKNLSFFTGEDVAKMRVKRLLVDGDIISLGELEFLVIHTPGHTPGSISLKYRDILFSGDALFFEGIGRTDVPGGDYEVLVRSIRERLFTLPDSVKVFPGHGPATTIGHEKKNNPFF
jgi:glyoxylase-like metal-dependent hydrolase (beta-lactamase superfamily II)